MISYYDVGLSVLFVRTPLENEMGHLKGLSLKKKNKKKNKIKIKLLCDNPVL